MFRSRMRSGRFMRNLSLHVGLSFTAIMVVIFTTASTELSVGFFASWYSILASLLLFLFLSIFLRCHFSEPETLTFSVFGLPGSGKTVYLRMLMGHLKKYNKNGVHAMHLNDKFNRQYEALAQQQQWPSRSAAPREVYPVHVTMGPSLLPQHLKVVLADHNYGRLAVNEGITAQSLASAGAYGVLAKSHGIILVIDASVVLQQHLAGLDGLKEIFIAAIEEVKHAYPAGLQIDVPLALLFTKIDTIEHIVQPSAVTGLMKDVVTQCRKSFKEFRIFYVSSVGHVTEQGVPESPVTPRNVVEPFIWMVKKYE